MEVVREFLKDRGWCRSSRSVAAYAVRGHHGRFVGGTAAENEFDPAVWQVFLRDLSDLVEKVLSSSSSISPEKPENASVTGVLMAGLIVFSDWIASNEGLFKYPELDSSSEPGDYYSAARNEATRALDRLGLTPPKRKSGYTSFADTWPGLTQIRPLQAEIECLCKDGLPSGLVIIEAPMGEGKTEAAIYLSEHWKSNGLASGTYIALPTMATSNQMHERYSTFLSEFFDGVQRPYLVHGMAWLMDQVAEKAVANAESSEEAEEFREWFRNARRALLSLEAVGTIDQALRAVLLVKFGFLRLYGLSRKVLIVDEVHACDEYMNVLLCRLLEWCGAMRVPVILLSATLTNRQKEQLARAYRRSNESVSVSSNAYPLITVVPEIGSPTLKEFAASPLNIRKVNVRRHHGLFGDAAKIANLAAHCVADGGCVCVLVNSVVLAQRVYRRLKKLREHGLDPSVDLRVFHSRFKAGERGGIEEQVVGIYGKDTSGKDRPERAILVATQVVEQSLDVDFDVMITELAPIDLILQRSGRLHRHLRPNRPVAEPILHVLLPDEGEVSYGRSVYDTALLMRTQRILERAEVLSIPDDIQPYIEECYDQSFAEGDLELAEATSKRCERQEKYRNEALTYLIPSPDPDEFRLSTARSPYNDSENGDASNYFYAQTRIGGYTLDAVILDDPKLVEMARKTKPPAPQKIAELLLLKAAIPRWWTTNILPDSGYDEPFTCDWLGDALVIPTVEKAWHGLKDGRSFAIKDDQTLGLYIQQEGKEEDDD
jgi:CRISPR-associated endonuclease/helicase Cas3